MEKFTNWRDKNLVLDDDGMVMIPTLRLERNYQREDGAWLSPPCYDDFEDLWDYQQTKISKYYQQLKTAKRKIKRLEEKIYLLSLKDKS